MNATSNSGLQAALDWLEANGENEELFKEPVGGKLVAKTCLMCNACKKKFSTLELAEVHAARTLHDDFAEAPYETEELTSEETAEPPVVLNEEQKAARLAELRAKLAIKRAEREKEVKEAEVLRKASSKELEQIRREMQVKEMKKFAEEQRLEKLADKKRREDIKKQIEEDRINKKKQIEAEKAKKVAENNVEIGKDEVVIIPVDQEPAKTNSTSARIQVKLPAPNGPLKLTFDSPATQTLKDLKLRIKEEYPAARSPMELIQTFPTRVFDADDDGCSLNDLGLSPSASLILK